MQQKYKNIGSPFYKRNKTITFAEIKSQKDG